MRSLVVGDWLVARCDEETLDVEYSLFDASDVLLSAAQRGFGTREQGYLTTAGIARERLLELGATTELAREAFEALGPLADLALAPSIARVADQLEACEALQGGRFLPSTKTYEGAWIDLDAVARACDLEDAATAMQLLHLLLVMEEVPKNTPVRLLAAGADVPPGHRSWRRVHAEGIAALPDALRAAPRPIVARAVEDEGELCEARVRELKARTDAGNVYRPRLHAIASALTRASAPPPVEVTVIEDDAFEPAPLVDELRQHADMLTSELHVREVAQFLTAMATARVSTDALAVLASRAWLAAGEIAYARYFARRVVEDATAPRPSRLAATEILDLTTATNESMRAPAVRAIEPTRIVDKKHEHAPAGASLPPMNQVTTPPPPVVAVVPRVEIVETMAAPAADTVRIRMTELARELARDYRLAYGITLKTDVDAVEAMQHHVRRRFQDAGEGERLAHKLETELTRHGALLSEILARSLGAYWLDTASAELGRWAMVVPPRTRVWPIGRVYRFFQRGKEDGDLVSFYVELERAARGS